MSAEGPAVLTRPSIDDVTAAIAQVPTMPRAVHAVMDACERPDTSAQDIARSVMADQGLTANVLRLANSAAYGHRRRVTTVSDAVVIMGMSAVKSLAISAHTADLLNRALPGYAMERGELWRHSLNVAFLCRSLTRDPGSQAREEAFVAGLLHDMGKVVLSGFLGDGFDTLTRAAHERRSPLNEAERELLGFDHADLGARLTHEWRFPGRLVEAIGVHHHPDDATLAPGLAACVSAADAVAHALAAGIAPDDVPHVVDQAWLDELDLTPHELAGRVAELRPMLDTDPLAD